MDLTTITERAGTGPLTMTSREVADLAGKRHDHVLRDVEKMLADLGTTSPQFWGDLPDAYGRPQRVAHLPKREALILVSGYSVEMRARIIDRWQELEAGAPPALNLRQPAQMLAVAMQLATLCQEQQALLADQAPKVAFHDAVADASNCQTVEQVGKVFGRGRNAMFKLLRELGMLMRGNLPYQEHVDAGRFRVVEKTYEDPSGQTHLYPQTLITGAGLAYIQRRLAAQQLTTTER